MDISKWGQKFGKQKIQLATDHFIAFSMMSARGRSCGATQKETKQKLRISEEKKYCESEHSRIKLKTTAIVRSDFVAEKSHICCF